MLPKGAEARQRSSEALRQATVLRILCSLRGRLAAVVVALAGCTGTGGAMIQISGGGGMAGPGVDGSSLAGGTSRRGSEGCSMRSPPTRPALCSWWRRSFRRTAPRTRRRRPTTKPFQGCAGPGGRRKARHLGRHVRRHEELVDIDLQGLGTPERCRIYPHGQRLVFRNRGAAPVAVPTSAPALRGRYRPRLDVLVSARRSLSTSTAGLSRRKSGGRSP
jgi:hypothetical protein